jgi:hypothetical protein
MVPFQESRPLPADLILRKVVMRFLEDRAVPLVDDWGGCVGIVHRDDCTKVCCAVLSVHVSKILSILVHKLMIRHCFLATRTMI